MLRLLFATLLYLSAMAAHAQTAQGSPTPDLGGSLWQMFIGLAAVLAILVASLWVLKRLIAQRGDGAGLLKVIAGAAVGTRERVVIVEVGSTWLVLGVAPGRVSALAEVPRQTVPAQSREVGSPGAIGFPEWLRKLSQGK